MSDPPGRRITAPAGLAIFEKLISQFLQAFLELAIKICICL